MSKNKIIFLDIDGVLNKHDITSINDDRAILRECVSEINHILLNTSAQIVIISNWAQILTLEQITERIVDKGLFDKVIIDSIKVTELKAENTIVTGIEKDKFILNYVKENNIENYVIIDDNINSVVLDKSKLVQTQTYSGITKIDSERAINILNNGNKN